MASYPNVLRNNPKLNTSIFLNISHNDLLVVFVYITTSPPATGRNVYDLEQVLWFCPKAYARNGVMDTRLSFYLRQITSLPRYKCWLIFSSMYAMLSTAWLPNVSNISLHPQTNYWILPSWIYLLPIWYMKRRGSEQFVRNIINLLNPVPLIPLPRTQRTWRALIMNMETFQYRWKMRVTFIQILMT